MTASEPNPEHRQKPEAERDTKTPDADGGSESVGDEESDELVPVSDDAARIGTTVGERYHITKLIGSGGMGAVYEAEHIHMKKQVALKVLHREMTILDEVVARFEREAIAAARIDHPNVVQARDFGRLEDGAYYLVLDYVDGESLSHVLKHEEFSIGRSLHLALQVAEALGAAHEQGIVHRDLKPDNVMLVRPASGFERVKVLDFGIAKVSIHERGRSARPLTRIGSVFGTPEYMSPEQAAGQRVDQRADLYSLGLLIYRMVAGRAPFKARNLNQVLMMQITQPAPELPEAVPESVRALVRHLLEKMPEQRPQSAAEVVRRIVELLEHTSAEALSRSLAPPRDDAIGDTGTSAGSARKLGAKLDRSFLGARIVIGDDSVPLWRLGVVGLLLVGLGATLVTLLRSPTPSTTPELAAPLEAPSLRSSATPSTPVDPHLEKLLAEAFAGNDAALLQLEKRSAEARTVREWLALGRGRAKLEKHLDAVRAYEHALETDPAAGADPKLRKDVATAIRDEAAVDAALELAARHLGSAGADMLYQAWVETKEVTPTTQLARKLLLRENVRANASPALAFLLDWREALSCDDYRKLLPRAAVAADARALTLLSRLQVKNDCELPQEAIEAAISASKDRPRPTSL